MSATVLAHYNPDLPVRLAWDASAYIYIVESIISHAFPNGEECLIVFASRTLTASEKNYSQLEKETLFLGSESFTSICMEESLLLTTTIFNSNFQHSLLHVCKDGLCYCLLTATLSSSDQPRLMEVLMAYLACLSRKVVPIQTILNLTCLTFNKLKLFQLHRDNSNKLQGKMLSWVKCWCTPSKVGQHIQNLSNHTGIVD